MTELKKENLTLIRKYIFECVLIVLCVAVVTLANAHNSLELEMKKYLHDDREKLINVLQENTAVLRTLSK